MITVLFSGGIDSWACLNWAISTFGKKNIKALYALVGSSYASRELAVAGELCSKLGVVLETTAALDMVENPDDGHIPLRNTFLLLQSALDEECEGVVFGMLRGDSCEDKNNAYVALMQKLFDSQFKKSIYRKTTRPFVIYTPFGNDTKTQLVAWAKKNTSLEWMMETVGCYSYGVIPCGRCTSCFNRWVALYNNDLYDKGYIEHPFIVMTQKLADLGSLRKDNPALFSLKQLWLKRYWILDSYSAMNAFCRRTFHHRLSDHIIALRKANSNAH